MPNETIFCNAGSKLTIHWGKKLPPDCGSTDPDEVSDPSVILTSLKAWEDPDGTTGGWDVVEAWHLDEQTIDRLLQVLGRASNQAYGTNLGGLIKFDSSVWCTCGVVAGGHRAPSPSCKLHNGIAGTYTYTVTYTA